MKKGICARCMKNIHWPADSYRVRLRNGYQYFCRDKKNCSPIARLEAARDRVNHVAHYNAGKIECIDAMEAAIVGQTAFEGAMSSTAIKYIWRWKHKNGAEDLRKAIWYLNRLIAHLEKQ